MAEPVGRELNRRDFAKAAIGAGLVAAAGGGTTIWLVSRGDDGSFRPYAFDIAHADDIYVHITSGDPMVVSVREVGGAELEWFDVTVGSLLDIESEHITLREAPIPTAA